MVPSSVRCCVKHIHWPDSFRNRTISEKRAINGVERHPSPLPIFIPEQYPSPSDFWSGPSILERIPVNSRIPVRARHSDGAGWLGPQDRPGRSNIGKEGYHLLHRYPAVHHVIMNCSETDRLRSPTPPAHSPSPDAAAAAPPSSHRGMDSSVRSSGTRRACGRTVMVKLCRWRCRGDVCALSAKVVRAGGLAPDRDDLTG